MADTSKFFLAYIYDDKQEQSEIIGLTDEMKKKGDWLVYKNEDDKDIELLFFDDSFYILNNFNFEGKREIGCLGIKFSSPERAIAFALDNDTSKMILQQTIQKRLR